MGRAFSLKPELLQKPIITITQDSPEPVTPTSSNWFTPRKSSVASLLSDKSEKSDTIPGNPAMQSMHRSATDTDISYHTNEEKIEEVPGSVFYIQANGQLSYEVILKAVHAVSSRECSGRVCGLLLNILNCLADLGMIEKHEKEKKVKLQVNPKNITRFLACQELTGIQFIS